MTPIMTTSLISGKQNNYQAISGYLDETLIDIKYNSQAAYCVARAVVPLEDESNMLINTALGGIIGLMLSTGGVFVFTWWTSEKESV